MDFVYDKPIFTQWTFAPAEPQTKKKAHGHGHSEKAHQKKAHGHGHSEQESISEEELIGRNGYSAVEVEGKLKILKMATHAQQRKLIELSKHYNEDSKNYLELHAQYKKLLRHIKAVKNDEYKEALKLICYELLFDVGREIMSRKHDMKTVDNITNELEANHNTHVSMSGRGEPEANHN